MKNHLAFWFLFRVLVSSYLFLNGFGHFCFAWKEIKDGSGQNNGDLQKSVIRFFTVRNPHFFRGNHEQIVPRVA